MDVIWDMGGAIGDLVGKLVLYLRVHYREGVGLEEFLTLGLIALAYGAALLAHTLGFLAVFATGLALRRRTQMTKLYCTKRNRKLPVKPSTCMLRLKKRWQPIQSTL